MVVLASSTFLRTDCVSDSFRTAMRATIPTTLFTFCAPRERHAHHAKLVGILRRHVSLSAMSISGPDFEKFGPLSGEPFSYYPGGDI